jgi:hypothetical protein
LGHDLAVGLRCLRCGTRAPILRPLYRLTERDALCPVCGEPRVPDVVDAIRGDESILDQPLAGLGVPPLAILTAYNRNQTLGLELTGDAASFFAFS